MKHSRILQTTAIIALATSLSGCASFQKQLASFKHDLSKKSKAQIETPVKMSAAILEDDFDPILEMDGADHLFDAPMIMPAFIQQAQMKLRPASYVISEPVQRPFEAIRRANASSSIEPNHHNYLNAIQVYPYASGSLYQVYCAPEQVTDIALEPGEELTSVSAGDTVRWIVGDTVSGAEGGEQVHILIKPTKPNLTTNLVITTSKRTYYVELHAYRDTYMAAVSWRYPKQGLGLRGTKKMKYRTTSKKSKSKAVTNLSIDKLNFAYKIKGDHPDWRPLRAFDDGKKVFIQFPDRLSKGEAPPLFVMGKNGKKSKTLLVNYRVKGSYYIVDRLFNAAELRLGEKDQEIVRIVRDNKS